MGAWIEMSVVYLCGVRNKVAPFMGAWIEMLNCCSPSISYPVAPFMGAWIEISASILSFAILKSLPSWERGLKYTQLLKLYRFLRRSLHGSVD